MSPERREQLRKLLEQKVPYKEISKIMGISKSHISGHSMVFGFPRKKKGTENHYDWKAIQKDLDSGMSVAALKRKYGFARASFGKAKQRGDIKHLDSQWLDANEYYLKVKGKFANHSIRKRMKQLLIKAGRKYQCVGCGITAIVKHQLGEERMLSGREN